MRVLIIGQFVLLQACWDHCSPIPLPPTITFRADGHVAKNIQEILMPAGNMHTNHATSTQEVEMPGGICQVLEIDHFTLDVHPEKTLISND